MDQLEQNIMDYVRSEGAVTCVALYQLFGEGDSILVNATVRNVVCAFGMSEELANALNHLLDIGELVDIPCTTDGYAFDGAVLRLPITDLLMPIGGYDEPHWQPILYTTYETAIAYLNEVFENDPEQLAEVKARLSSKRKVAGIDEEPVFSEEATVTEESVTGEEVAPDEKTATDTE